MFSYFATPWRDAMAAAVLLIALPAMAQDDFAPRSHALVNEISDARVELAVLPTYPDRAKRNGIDGEITVRFTVSRYGRAIDAQIISATPRRVFDSAVLDALKYWFIRPARADVCVTTQQQAEQTFRFRHDADPAVQVTPLVIEGRLQLAVEQQHVDKWEPGTGTDGFSAAVADGALVVTKRIEPEFPDKAVQRKREGFVTVSFFIEKDGRVTDPKVEASKNGMLFNRAALKAIKQWTFAPALRNGQPVERFGCHEFLFNLDARAIEQQKQRILDRSR